MGRIITFLTRTTCDRPIMLGMNIDSLLMQTDDGWDQVILEDKERRGKFYASKMPADNKEKVSGQYIYILDDDHRLIIPDFVAGIRAIVEDTQPDIIMVKCKIRAHGILPNRWGRAPKNQYVDTGCFLVEQQLWKRHIHLYALPASGDHRFICHLWRVRNVKIEWWDKLVAEDMRETMEWA